MSMPSWFSPRFLNNYPLFFLKRANVLSSHRCTCMNMSTHTHTCTRVCTYSYTQTHFGNSSNITISNDAIVDGEFQELHPDNPSWPIIAGILFPQIHHTENMSEALGNKPRLRHAEKGKLSLGRAGFGLPGAAQNAWGGVSDSISRYRREGSVIGKRCPSRKLALFNKQCPLKKFKIFQRRNAVPRVALVF